MAFDAKVAYLGRWGTATPCTHVEPSVRSLLARRREKDALVDFIPIERATHLRTLTECRSCSTTAEPSVRSTGITAAFSPPKAQPEDGTLLSFENALRAVQALPLEDIIPTADFELPLVAPVNPQALQPSRRVDYDIEPVRFLSAPEVPGLADLVEVDWMDFIGYGRLREVPPLESLPLVDPSPVPVKAALNSPASPEKRWAAASAVELELDPIPLALQREQVHWIFSEPVTEAPLLTSWLAEKSTSDEDDMHDLLTHLAKGCDFYREIPPLSPLAPSRQQRSVSTRPERPVFGPIGLSWETMDCQLNLLVPREVSVDMTRIELKGDFTASGDGTAAAVDAVKRIFKRELSSVRRGGWEQTILWDKSWSGTALGLPQPPELPPVDWLVPKDTSIVPDLPVLAEREVDCPCDAAQAELLWRWARHYPDAGRARLNLCIRSWELLTTSAVEVAPLSDEQQVTELTPTQEQDETHFEEGGGALERDSGGASGSPSTPPPPPLMSCISDHPSVPIAIDVERQSDCVCVRKSASIGRTAKVIRATGQPSAVTTLRTFLNKHWDRLRRFCGMHGLGVPTAQASLAEAEEIWQHSLSRKPRRSAQQLGSLALRCIVLSTLLEAFASYGSVGLLMTARAVPNEYRSNADTLGRTLVELLSRLESSKSVLTQCPILRSLRSLLTGARQVRTLVVVVSSTALAENYERVSRKLLGMLGEDISVVNASQAGADCGGGSGRRTLCFIPEWGILPDAVISEDASDCYARDPRLCSLLSRSGATVVAFEALLGLENANPVAFDLIKFHIRHGKEGAASSEELSVRLKAAASKELGEALMAARIACEPALAGAVSLPGISAVVELTHQTSVAVLEPHGPKLRASTLESIRGMARSLKRLYVIVPLVASRSKVSSTGDASLAMSMCLEELGCGPGHGSRLAVEGWTETTLKLGMMDKVVPVAVPVRGSVIDSVVRIIKQLAATEAGKEDPDGDSIDDEGTEGPQVAAPAQRRPRQGEAGPSGEEPFEVDFSLRDISSGPGGSHTPLGGGDAYLTSRAPSNSGALHNSGRLGKRQRGDTFSTTDEEDLFPRSILDENKSEGALQRGEDWFSFDGPVSLEGERFSGSSRRSTTVKKGGPQETDFDDSWSFTDLTTTDDRSYLIGREQSGNPKHAEPTGAAAATPDDDGGDFSSEGPLRPSNRRAAGFAEGSLVLSDTLNETDDSIPKTSAPAANLQAFMADSGLSEDSLSWLGMGPRGGQGQKRHRVDDSLSGFGSLVNPSSAKEGTSRSIPSHESREKTFKFRVSSCPSPGRVRGGLCEMEGTSPRYPDVTQKGGSVTRQLCDDEQTPAKEGSEETAAG
ncbi:hypothetical protein FOZ61_008509 [Perkinsus olseni]|uniref:Uncharacterized protein n=1 Tax=Perkinsus olseni TaxID=32597 RepID=A0A7J6L364_PEROL|nr:hypothetical protein FOZ61_008509 [Perkinsus olseni]